ncbi:hypothetical protein FRC03_008827 [Tulasnella sp. 419]|nr:hypothetical protein FRC02_009681 [Tulasnella sp. 418]KAG8958773.1 hypothetical protein FRC03_008827 [Tulasnella sp. 419]
MSMALSPSRARFLAMTAMRAIGPTRTFSRISPVIGSPVFNQRTPLKAFYPSTVRNYSGGKSIIGEETWKAPVVTHEEVKAKSSQPSLDSYIIDVREPDEVAQGSIPSSVAIPLSTFEKSLALPDIEFEAKHGFNKPSKDQEVIFYCRSGKRSETAAREAHRQGYTNVKNYSGSWLDWVAKEQEKK